MEEVEEGSDPAGGRVRRVIKPRRRYGEEDEDVADDEEQESEEQQQHASSSPVVPKKRGRGRPRKHPVIKKENVDSDEFVTEFGTEAGNRLPSHTDNRRVTEDLEYVKDTISALPSSSLATLLAPIFERLGPEQQEKQLDELLQVHLGTYKEAVAKKVPKDFMKQAIGAMEHITNEHVDNVPYFLNKALATNSLPVHTASFAMLQIVVMSLFSNRLEEFFTHAQASEFSNWLDTACSMFPASTFLDHLNSVLFPLTNMQFVQTATTDSDQLCIVLEILALVEDACNTAVDTPEDAEPNAVQDAENSEESAQFCVLNEPEEEQAPTTTSQDKMESVGMINPETGLLEELDASWSNGGSKKERKRRRVVAPGEVTLNEDGKAFCEECDLTFRENRNYFKHLELHDGRKSHSCPFCEKRYDLRRVLFNHIMDNHCKDQSTDGYSCQWCHFLSAKLTNSFKHHIRHHMTEKIECEFCQRNFHTKSYLKEHIELQHNGPPYSCFHCDTTDLETKDDFRQHLKTAHKPGLVCKVCRKPHKNRRDHQEHLATHAAEDLIVAGVKSKAVAHVIKDVIENEKEEKRKAKEQVKEKLQALKEEGVGEAAPSSPKRKCIAVQEVGTDGQETTVDLHDVIDMSDPACRLREKPHKCKYCRKSFTKPEVLKRHIARHLGDNVEYKCRFCDSMYQSQRDARRHELEQHCLTADGTYACQWCQKTFKSPVKLRSHEWLHTKDAKFQCQFCAHRCKSKSILMRHENSHLGIRPHKCPHCDRSFSLKHALEEHINAHKGLKPFICEYCPNRRFRSKAQLKSHIGHIHKGLAKSYVCSVCNKGFTTKASLQIHTRIHTGERPFQCKSCGKAFSNLTGMKRHEMAMHSAGDGPHICPYCQKEFAYKYSMYYHRKLVHETEAKLKCSYCDKKFRRRQEVMLHELVHTGVKAFHCRDCGKSFRTKSQMSEHAIIHRGVPRFKCPSCDKAFLHRSSYKRHVMLHEGLLPHECPHCDKAFPDRSNLLSHVRHIHKDEATDPTAIPTPKVRHAPALLPPEFRKYPKPRNLETIETDTSGQIEYEIIKTEPGDEDSSGGVISGETLRVLLENSSEAAAGNVVNHEQVSYLLDNGEYVQVMTGGEYENAAAVMAVEEGGGEQTYNLEIHQDGVNVDAEGTTVDMQLLQHQQIGGGEGTEEENMNMVEVETEGGKQIVYVPQGTRYVQLGDQLLEIEGEGGVIDAGGDQMVEVGDGGIGSEQVLHIEAGDGQ